MVAQRPHRAARLRGQCVQVRAIARVVIQKRARQRELLPRHDPKPVAVIPKSPLLAHAATPHAQEVDPCVPRHPEQASVVILRHTAGQHIGRNPIRPAQEDRPPVDQPPPLAAIRKLRPRHRAHADDLARLIQHAGIIQQPDGHPVEVRLALVPRPPEAGGGKVEAEVKVEVRLRSRSRVSCFEGAENPSGAMVTSARNAPACQRLPRKRT